MSGKVEQADLFGQVVIPANYKRATKKQISTKKEHRIELDKSVVDSIGLGSVEEFGQYLDKMRKSHHDDSGMLK